MSKHIKSELARRELARRELLSYICYMKPDYKVGWFHKQLAEIMDAFVEAVNRKGSPRIILSVAPRVGKSTAVSEYLPTYILGKNPKAEIVAATYNQDLANSFGRKVRDILQNPQYLDLFNVELDTQAQSVNYVRLSKGGSYYAVGAGGSLTGRGADVMIIDDPVKDREAADSPIESEKLWEWYSSTARTRMLPGGGIIIVMTRWATDDLAGRLIDQANRDPDADQWKIVNFPALAEQDEEFRKKGEALHPERYDRDAYLRLKASIQPRDWASLYCGKPYVEGGNFFSQDTVRYYKDKPAELTWLIGVDYATSASKKSDKSAIVPMGVDYEGNVYIGEDFFYDNVDPWDAVVRTIALAKKYEARDLAGESGPIQNTMGPIFSRVQEEQHWYVTVSKNVRRSSKAVASLGMKALMFNGKLHFPDTPRMRNEIIPELLAFDPKVDRGGDDFIDGIVNGCLLIESIGRPLPPAPPPPKWRTDPGAVYGADVFKKKKGGSATIPGLRSNKW